MGMSTHVIGFKPPDEHWKKMAAVWKACKEAGTDCPEEVFDFFNGQEPDPIGVEVDLTESGCVKEWSGEMTEGFEVELDKIPKGVKFFRFFNHW